MSIYLKHMGGYKHNQLKGISYDEIQKPFDKEMKRVNSFGAMNSEAQEINGKKDESSSKKTEITQDSSAKRAGDKLESYKSKKQKTDENEEDEVDNEAELKMHMVIVKDDDIVIDAIPLATKPPMIRRLGDSLEVGQKKHGNTRPEDEHERLLWGDLKVMFEPDIKSVVWRNLQGYKVTIWKLLDSCGVHFIRHVKRGRDTKIPRSSGPPVKVGDVAVHKELGDRMERAATTASSLEADEDSVKVNTVNGERQLQALVDKKRVIITESSIRSDLHLEDAGGIGCLPTATIFE
ncbi:hypothetical protein Tco_1250602, partial [Tanacetum coccineum]